MNDLNVEKILDELLNQIDQSEKLLYICSILKRKDK